MAARKTAKKATAKTTKKLNTSSTRSSVKSARTLSIAQTAAVSKKQIIIGAAVVVIVALLFLGRSLFIAAMVDGKPISRFSVIKNLEKQGGRQALDNLITQQLIIDEAQKRNITASQDEISKQTSTIEKNIQSQGSTLDQALAQQGMTRQELNDQLKLQILLDKMVPPSTVSAQEVSDYMDKNKDQLPQGESQDQLSMQVEQQLQQQKQQQATQTFVNNLKKNANIVTFVNY